MNYPWLQDAWRDFESYSAGGRLPHALLIAGPSGCGKVSLSRDIARQLLCLEGAPGGCGDCRSCHQVRGGAHPDYREITFELRKDGKTLRDVITVGQIRGLIEAMYKTTTTSPRKVAVIHPAECMHHSAANALLKTLEEPVGDTVLILVASDPGRLPATVRSRCQRLNVALPPHEAALEWLVQQAGADAAEAKEALVASAGRPLAARDMLDGESLQQYRTTVQVLGHLRAGTASDGRALAAMADFDPALVWGWLSLICADAVRRSLARASNGADTKSLIELQRLADRNRLLAATPVRKDLLLRDWLIQWQNLPATLPLERHTQEA